MSCESCEVMAKMRKLLKSCETCDNGSHHGASHVQATNFTLAQRKLDDHTPSAGVTRLAPDDEDVLRRAMATLFSMAATDLLLVRHMMRGGDLAGYVDELNVLDRKIRSIRGNPRAFADEVKKRVIRTMPAIEPVMQDLISR